MDASGRHGASIFSHKKKAGGDTAAVTPGFCLLTEGIRDVDAADLLGHESIETTRIYLTRSSKEQKLLLDKMVTW